MRLIRWSMRYKDFNITGSWNSDGVLKASELSKKGLMSVAIEEREGLGSRDIIAIPGAQFEKFMWIKAATEEGSYPVGLEIHTKSKRYTVLIEEELCPKAS